ncbi:MAG TPA: glucosidase, partial [Candidatus Limnocylindria bacterium]
MMSADDTAERGRLAAARDTNQRWRLWGPYLSERQWGTVREDYSEDGDAWSYFSHDHARSRAYRWGEDGIAGYSDERQILCFALGLWNGRDPILKERLFGLTNQEGNHGEDVKEYYFYLDATPTNSYLRYLYRYPQSAFPYDDLVSTNAGRSRTDPEYELIDTGAFDGDRYFDVVVEYAKANPTDTAIRITVTNQGPEAAAIHLLPTLWFRNSWSWGGEDPPPTMRGTVVGGSQAISASHAELGEYRLTCEGATALLFTENETNTERLNGAPNRTPFVKDGIERLVVHGDRGAVNPGQVGTKAAAHYELRIEPGASVPINLWLRDAASPEGLTAADVETVIDLRRAEADEFYATVIPPSLSEDQRSVMRQALAGMLWSKQTYAYDVHRWLGEHGSDPLAGDATERRNLHWHHMLNADVISMPDKWEYPWFAAWDLAFHVIALSVVDADFAKDQLELMLRSEYLHPNGQLPAYEWNFGD